MAKYLDDTALSELVTKTKDLVATKMDKVNPTGTGSFSLNRVQGYNPGSYAFIEGYNNGATGEASHAEGSETFSSGTASHTEGANTAASGNASHAEGTSTKAVAPNSHAEGNNTTVLGYNAHAEGLYTAAVSANQHVFGKYNILDYGSNFATEGSFIEIAGNGTATDARSNARTLDWAGNEVLAGTLKTTGFIDGNNANYKLVMPDSTSWTADKIIATTDQIPTVNNATLTIQLNGSTIDTFTANASSNKTVNVKALPNYSLSIGSTNGGNPRQVLFCSVNYTNFDSNSGAYFKLGVMSGHGNGSSYTFVEDIFINVNYQGTVTCQVYKYVQQAVTLDSVARNYGDVFYTIDTTNKIVYFYILLGQYSSAQFTPATKIGAAKAVTSANGIVQNSGTPTYYSSGTKVWATGNSALYVRSSDLATVATTGSYDDLTNKPTIPSGVTSINGLSGGSLTSPLVIKGGDAATAAKIALDQTASGQITNNGTQTLFGFTSNNATSLTVGHSSYTMALRGSGTRPKFNGNDLALYSDLPTVPTTLPVTYVTTEPSAANTSGLKVALLDSEPSTKYDGWIYMIKE